MQKKPCELREQAVCLQGQDLARGSKKVCSEFKKSKTSIYLNSGEFRCQ